MCHSIVRGRLSKLVDEPTRSKRQHTGRLCETGELSLESVLDRRYPMLVCMARRMAPPDGQVRSPHSCGFEAPDLVNDVCAKLHAEGMTFTSDRHFVGVFKTRLRQRVSKHLKRINGRRQLNERYMGHGEQ